MSGKYLIVDEGKEEDFESIFNRVKKHRQELIGRTLTGEEITRLKIQAQKKWKEGVYNVDLTQGSNQGNKEGKDKDKTA